MKKAISMMLATAMAATCLAGCGSAASSSAAASSEAVASCLYTQIPESRINTELFNHHQKTEYPYNHTENAF